MAKAVSDERKLGRATPVCLYIAFALLVALHAHPWFPGEGERLVLGIIPLPLLLWILWTALLVAFIGYISFIRDPYALIVQAVKNAAVKDAPAGQNTNEPT